VIDQAMADFFKTVDTSSKNWMKREFILVDKGKRIHV